MTLFVPEENRNEFKFEVCELVDHQIKRLYYSQRFGDSFFSRTKATLYSASEARQIVDIYRTLEPEREIFVQSPYDAHYAKVNELGYVM